MNDLLHFSATPLRRIRNAKQGVVPDDKPNGLWLSVGESWAEWCQAESFALDRFAHVARIRLAEDAKILTLGNATVLDTFTRQYGEAPTYRPYDPEIRNWPIAWTRVASEFDGIIIAPYVYERRHALLWYYGWDVASGCIWNAAAIAGFDALDLTPSLPPSSPTDHLSEEI